MRKKRILYNELNEEIYETKFWKRNRLIALGAIILFLGFLINFSLEEKINKGLSLLLSKNPNCPIQFEKIELNYFLPKIIIKKPSFAGICFGQVNNRLTLDEIKLKLDFPSITHFGIRFSTEIKQGKDTQIYIDPIFSPFSTFIEIEPSKIDAKIIQVLTADGKSPVSGRLNLDGFLKFQTGTLIDGEVNLSSNDFNFPSQRISGFDLPLIMLYKFNLHALFEGSDKSKMKIKKIEIGKAGTPININLSGDLLISKDSFANSILILNGIMQLSPSFMTNFSFVTLLLPPGRTNGKYLMKIQGPLINPGSPTFQ